MESEQERIADIARKTGATEDEARIFYHLGRARNAWFALPQAGSRTLTTARFSVHYLALIEMVQARIARRDHPEGWGQPEAGE